MSSKKKKKRQGTGYSDIQLNLMPFIDAFSILVTFLLMSAVFVTLGIVEVQIPFLSSTPPPDKPTRSLSIKVDLEKDKIEVISEYSMAPKNREAKDFQVNEAGISAMHRHLVSVRSREPEADMVSLYTEDEVTYEDIAKVLDAIKFRQPNDPIFPIKGIDGTSVQQKETAASFLFPKVVMSSVML